METVKGTLSNVIAAGMTLGGLPLLAFELLFLQLMAAMEAGHPQDGDALGMAMMSALSFAIAALSLAIGFAYFGYKLLRRQQAPRLWHKIVIGCLTLEVIAPFAYLAVS